MSRPIGATVALGAAAAGALVTLAIVTHDSRMTRSAQYRSATVAQERELSRALPPVIERGALPMGSPVCVTGVDTFATAIADLVTTDLRSPDAQTLAAISGAALRAERFVENESPAPTLPGRMGSVEQGDGRVPVEPTRQACRGRGYAVFSLELPSRPAGP